MQELMEQVQIEYLPTEAAQNDHFFDPGFQHFALLYIKYLQIYRKLEDCHDQMVHPQKRRSIKKVLRLIIIRILELKQKLIAHNPRPENHFVALDEVLSDLKLNPATVEWRVPRYFHDDKECREEIEEKMYNINHWLTKFGYSLDPDPLLDKKDPFIIGDTGLSTNEAIHIIQINERGRQGFQKAVKICEYKREQMRKDERARKLADRGSASLNEMEAKVLAATRIAAHWRRKLDRRMFLKMKEEELEFLGMAPPRNDSKEERMEDMLAHRDRRKKMQEDADEVYEKSLKDQLDWLHKKKGADIKADLLEERRQWILEYCQQPDKGLKFPADFDEFYQRFDKEEEVAVDGSKAAKGANGGKDGKGKGKDGKGKGPGEEEESRHGGPSEVVQQFAEQITQYTEMWENRNELNNFDQKHDVEMARKNVLPMVETELRVIVDEMMKEELANLRVLFEEAKKKPKKNKPPKKPKGPKAPKKWNKAQNMIDNPEDCMPDLIKEQMLKKVAPCYLDDFLGEYHYLGAMQRCHQEFCPPPSAQMIRSLLIEHCVLPLAATDIRQKAPPEQTARSLFLYGPKGSGKSMLARAIATETGATFFDLSPSVIDGKFMGHGNIGPDLLIYTVYVCARNMAPSVIYIDQCEQVFQATSKKKTKDGAGAASRIKAPLIAMLKQIQRGDKSTEQDRILIIGASSRPFDENLEINAVRNFFDEKVWVSYPEYGSRVMLWQRFMEQHKVRVDPVKHHISTLAAVSDGYSAGCIKRTVDRVLTERRVQQLERRPLKVQEFLGPLARTSNSGYCWEREFQRFRLFDHDITGELALKEARLKEQAEAEVGKGGKGGKKGK